MPLDAQVELPSWRRPVGLEKFASAILPRTWLSPFEKLALTKPSSSTVTPCSSPTERQSWNWANISVDPVFCVLPARSIVICWFDAVYDGVRSIEHTSEIKSLMHISSAALCSNTKYEND